MRGGSLRNVGLRLSEAFTLAEVLITLSIIGVVAALTIPSLLINNRNKELEVSFKAAHSILASAINSLSIQNPNIYTDYGNKYYEFGELIMSAFNGSRRCLPYCILPQSYKDYSGRGNMYATNGMSSYQIQINNGMTIFTIAYSSPANELGIVVDTNGYQKGPNRAGYDLFWFNLVTNNKFLPTGSKGTWWAWHITDNGSDYCDQNTAGGNNGMTCGYYALTDSNYFKNLK